MNNEKINSKIKLSNNSFFVILIFVILKFRNIGRSTFRRSKFSFPPLNFGIKLGKQKLQQSALVIKNIPEHIYNKYFPI